MEVLLEVGQYACVISLVGGVCLATLGAFVGCIYAFNILSGPR